MFNAAEKLFQNSFSRSIVQRFHGKPLIRPMLFNPGNLGTQC